MNSVFNESANNYAMLRDPS